MGRPKKEDMVKYSYWEVTPKQKVFLEELAATGSAKEACKQSGIEYKDFKKSITESESNFVTAYRHTLEKIDDDFDYSRYRNLHDLNALRDRLLDELEDVKNNPEATIAEVVALTKGAVSIIQEMNKMKEGNLAATKRINENRDLKLNATIDLTKSRRDNGLKEIEIE